MSELQNIFAGVDRHTQLLDSIIRDYGKENALKVIITSFDNDFNDALECITIFLKKYGYDYKKTKKHDFYAAHHYIAIGEFTIGKRPQLLRRFIDYYRSDKTNESVDVFLNSKTGYRGYTLLHLAAKYKREDLMNYLLHRGVDFLQNTKGEFAINYLTDFNNKAGQDMLNAMINYLKTKTEIVEKIKNQKKGMRVYQKAAFNGCLSALEVLYNTFVVKFSEADNKETGLVTCLIKGCLLRNYYEGPGVYSDAAETKEGRHKRYVECLEWILNIFQFKEEIKNYHYPYHTFWELVSGNLSDELLRILFENMSDVELTKSVRMVLLVIDYPYGYEKHKKIIVQISEAVKKRKLQVKLEDLDFEELYFKAVDSSNHHESFFKWSQFFQSTLENKWNDRKKMIYGFAVIQIIATLNWILFITFNIQDVLNSNQTQNLNASQEDPNLPIYGIFTFGPIVFLFVNEILQMIIEKNKFTKMKIKYDQRKAEKIEYSLSRHKLRERRDFENLRVLEESKGLEDEYKWRDIEYYENEFNWKQSKYFQNVYNWSQLVFFLFAGVCGFIVTYIFPEYETVKWIFYLIGTVATGWYLLEQLQVLPLSGIYIHCLSEVTKKSTLVISFLFLPFLFIFTAIFWILVPLEPYNSYSSLFKVLAMSLGEFEYNALLNEAAKHEYASWVTRFFFLKFAITMLVVLNLLIAFSVDVTSDMLKQANDHLLRRKLIQYCEWEWEDEKWTKCKNYVQSLLRRRSNLPVVPIPNQNNSNENQPAASTNV